MATAVDGYETGSSGAWSVWYAPGSVVNTNAVSHAGVRSVEVSGNVKFSVAPMVSQASFWHRRASGSASLSWQAQYFDANWTLKTPFVHRFLDRTVVFGRLFLPL